MDEKALQPINEEVRSALRSRLSGYQVLLLEYQTPLFRNELLDAIKLHEEALQRPDPTAAERQRVIDQLTVLDNMDDRLNKRWGELHKSMDYRVVLLANISEYQRALGAWLILNYGGKPHDQPSLWASMLVGVIDDFRDDANTLGKDFKVYQDVFVRPLKEMMLNQDHVEKRLRLAAARPTYSTGEIHRLIDQCDWPNLAAAVFHDRELAVVVFGARPLDPKVWEPHIGKTALQRIDELRDKYFSELLTPTTYTISRRAIALSTKQAARAAHHSSPRPLSSAGNQHSEESSAVTAAKSVYNKFVSGLGLGRTGSSLRSIAHNGPSTTSPKESLDSKNQFADETEMSE
ncbi:hypothetical protein J7T55_000685 [Diaporthe amygdali]|uniref:uncharacterized protein n=1 Tax=Phomopsis amygdali TaxID=1214568 RepID=UPI0022FE16E0|nr:uncharacterized protein J7T55_000685 [Diaporthe amygdali]KAJ0110252.1 hypothetical protein J7T55_000685 [Diaporthe amygdali]